MSLLEKIILLILLTGVFACSTPKGNESGYEQKADSLVRLMTMEEKIGQLIQENGGEGHDEAIIKGRVGSILNSVDVETNNRLQRLAVDSCRLGIPILFARDVIHGFKTIFPIPLGMAASFDPELVERAAEVAAQEAASTGIRWTFSPMVDISRDPRWGRVAETFGEDPCLQSAMGTAMVQGYQGDNMSRKGSIAACAKHFVAYGAAEGGRDYNTVAIPENVLRDVYFPPFRACVDAGVATFMPAFNEINGIPASGNHFLLDEVLFKEWGYEGFTVSDWESVIQLQTQGYTADLKESAEAAFNAGVQMEMNSRAYATHLAELISEGKVDINKLNDAVRRILRVKFMLGLFDDPFTDPTDYPEVLNDEYRNIAHRLAAESIVLLKNRNEILPLRRSGKKIAVIGPLADSPHDQLGTWIFDGDKKDAVTPLQSIREYYGTDDVLYAPGMAISRTKTKEGFPEAIRAAGNADIILLFIGEESILSGESHCRADLNLPGVQEALIEELAALHKPIIAVVMAGRPITFENVSCKLDAILFAWHPGTMAGPAITDIIAGVEVPSGKLPITFPRHVGQIPVYYNHKNTGKPASDSTWERLDDIPVEAPQLSIGNTNHYLDYGFEPWFPFGYGLSYTSFEYSDFKVNLPSYGMGDSIHFSVRIRNTGSLKGTEVVQLYIRDLVGSRTRPVKELKAFRRISLLPGEEKEVIFSLHTGQLGFYNQEMVYVTEPGNFKAFIGGDSTAGLQAEFRIE